MERNLRYFDLIKNELPNDDLNSEEELLPEDYETGSDKIKRIELKYF